MTVQQMKMPQLGESVTEGTLVQWMVGVGDTVKKYDPIAEITTDKVNAEVPSSFSGTITALHAEEGDTLPVGEAICSIAVADSAVKPAAQAAVPATDGAGGAPDGEPTTERRYSPAVRRLAREYAIDLERLPGSGRGGRVTRKDVLRYIKAHESPNEGQEARAQSAADPAGHVRHLKVSVPHEEQAKNTPDRIAAHASLPDADKNDRLTSVDFDIPLTAVRRTIARNMVRSTHEIPHAWMMVEVDVTNLVTYRNQIKGAFQKREGCKLTYLPFFIKAIVAALKEFPRMNSTWAEDKIIEKGAVNISLAVAAEDALYVPVIRHADEMSIKGLAVAIDSLAAKVRDNRLSPGDMQGGTFTVNNTGSFGSVQSQPIINYPQAAILSIESIVKRPVVVNQMIAIRDMVNLCISIDHRVLDGLITGRFLARVRDLLEHISPENTPVY